MSTLRYRSRLQRLATAAVVIVVAITVPWFANTSGGAPSDVDEPPVVSGTQGLDYAENGTDPVGTYGAADLEGTTVVWGVSGDDSNDFIISSGGVLSFVGSPDFEDPDDADRDNQYRVTVVASDGSETGSLDVAVTVADVNEPPVVSGADEVDHTENGMGVVATYTATDPEGAIVVWGVSGDDSAVFGISSGGALSFVGSPDFEDPDDADGDNRYRLTVVASDGSETGSLDVAVTVGDVNEPPVVSGTQEFGYAENGTDPVGTYTAADPEGATIVWGVSGEDSDNLSISSSGELSFVGSPDFEAPEDSNGDNGYLVTVEASDGGEASRLDVRVTVTDAPAVFGTQGVDYAENGTAVVGTYTAGGVVTWGVSGEDSDDFSIDSSTGVLRFVGSPDFEAPEDSNGDNGYLVTVEASDGGEASRLDVRVTVTDAPAVFGTQGVDYAENGTAVVGTYTAGGVVTWGVSGEDSDDFSIDSSTGVLRFVGSPDFEAPEDSNGDNGYLVTVEASDGTDTGRLDVVVTVADVNELPVLSGVVGVDYAENGTAVVGTYMATDPEGATIVWGLSGGDSDDFGISGGVLRFVGSPDFESPTDKDADNQYRVTVEASDGGETAGLGVVVTVTDAPVVSGTQEVDYAENGTAAVGTYTAGGAVTWGLSGDDSDDFGISGGVLRFVGSPDFESPTGKDADNQYRVTVEASDGGETGRLDVRVTVTDAPVVSGTREVDYAENGTAAVGKYAASGTVTWGLSGEDSNDFSISSGGVLSFGSSPDVESPTDEDTDNVYVVTVEASDGSETGRLAVAVTASDVNEPPVVSGAGAVGYAENGTGVVGTYVAADPEGVSVTWGLSGDDGAVFGISGSGVLSFVGSPDFEDPGDADGDNQYRVTVVASDRSETAGGLDVVVTVGDVNEPPTGLAVTAGYESVTLNWANPNNASITGYEYRQSTDGGATFGEFVLIGGSDAATTSYTIIGLTNDVVYTFEVRAVHSGVPGPSSDQVTTTPALLFGLAGFGVADAAVGTPAVLVSNAGETVSGTTNTNRSEHAQGFTTGKNTLGYVLTSVEVGIGVAQVGGTLTVTVRANDGGDPDSQVLHTLTNPVSLGTGLQVFTAAADAGLDANTRYFVHMAFTGTGTQPQWNFTNTDGDTATNAGWNIDNDRRRRVSGSTNWTTNSTEIQIRVNGYNLAPAAPTNLSAVPSDGQVVLSWDNPDNDTITGYRYRTDNGATFTNIDGSDASTTSHTVMGLDNGTTHMLAIRAVNDSGAGAVATLDVVMVPAAPAGLSAMPGDGQVVLSWDNPGNNTITKYQYSIDGGMTFTEIVDSDASTITYTVTGLANGTTHMLAVRAVNDSGDGAASIVSAVMVPDQPTGFIAAAENAQVALTWDDPGILTTIDKYQLLQLELIKLTADDGEADDLFGHSVAVDGNTAVIGAYQDDDKGDDSGSAYVFIRESGGWSKAAKLTASDGLGDDEFGRSVAVDGDTVVVGAYQDDDQGDDSGSVYVFTKPAGGWVDANETAKLTASDGAQDDRFGYSVALDGNTIVIGADQDDSIDPVSANTISNSGSAYVFIRESGVWSQAAKLTASDGLANDHFGWSVAVESDTVVVGAYGDDDPSLADGGLTSGSAYVFTKPDNGWDDENYDGNETAKLTAPDAAAGDLFGISVAVDGSTVVVGAYLEDAKASNSGSVYAFTKPASNNGWADIDVDNAAKLTASDGGLSDEFGWSVAVDGNTAVVGAHQDNDNGGDSGSAYVYKRDSSGVWNEEIKLTAPDGANDDRFGWSVAVDGSTALVGMYGDDDNGDDSGSAYILDIPAWSDIADSGVTTTSYTVEGLTNDVEYTFQIRAVNTTGLGRGSLSASATPVLLKPDQPTGLSATAGNTEVTLDWDDPGPSTTTTIDEYQLVQLAPSKLVASDGLGGDYFGMAVAVDGGTAIVGAFRDYHGASTSGSAYVFTRDSSGVWSQVAKLTASDGMEGDSFGWSVALDGDIAVVGAYLDEESDEGENPVSDSGAVYVFTKPAGGWVDGTETAKLTASDAAASDRFGDSVAVDDDTVVVGAYLDDEGGSGSGAAYVFIKPDAGWDDENYDGNETAKLTASDGAANDNLGTSVAVHGSNIVVGASGNDGKGAAYVFIKPDTGWDDENYDGNETAKLTASDGVSSAKLGISVAVYGDNVVVGASGDDDNGASSGSAYVFTKPGNAWIDVTERAKLTASDGESGEELGISVAVYGDNVVVGAHKDDDNGDDSGSAYLFTKPDTGWTTTTETAKIVARDGADDDRFGWSVAVDGSTAVVGAYQDDEGGDDSGSAHILAIPAWTDIADSDAMTTSYTVTGLTNDVEYTFQIRAVNTTGHSPASARASATPVQLKPDQPTGLTATRGNTEVTLGWHAPEVSAIKPVDEYQLWQLAVGKLSVSDGAANDEVGFAVAVDGDTVVVGAPGDDGSKGSAYVFTKGASGVWSQQTKLTATGGADDDWLGFAVAVDGDTVVIGAYGDDSDKGSAYVFTRVSGVWSQQATLTADDGVAGDWFGYSVAVEGDTAVVGAYQDDENGDGSGSAYVFTRESGAWDDGTKLTATDGDENHGFGASVAVDGDTVVVGATGSLSGADVSSGAAYLFTKPDNGWDDDSYDGNETAKLTPSDGADTDFFGYTVAVNSDTVLIGAYGHATDGRYGSGAAYLFTMPDTGWDDADETVKLVASDGAAEDYFGSSVAVDGDVALITATDDDDTGDNSGSAYLFTKDAGTWTETVKLTAPDGAAGDYFGWSVAMDGNAAVFGASLADDDAKDSGAAYVLDIGEWTDIADSHAMTTSYTVTGLTNDVKYTFQIRAVNTTGHSPASDSASATPVQLKPDQPTGLTATAGNTEVTLGWHAPEVSAIKPIDEYQLGQLALGKLSVSDGAENDEIGYSVAVDGGTVIVGAPGDDGSKGSAYVFTKDSSGVWSQQTKLTATGAGFGDSFGFSVAVDGDTVVIGAYGDDSGKGSAYVFTRVSGVWSQQATLTADDGVADDWFGWSVAVDGDTAVIGAYGDDSDKGSVYVFTRESGAWDDGAKLTATDGETNHGFGYSVAVDGDTVVVGAVWASQSLNGADVRSGSAYVFTKPDTGWADANETAKLTPSDGADFDHFGRTVAVDSDTIVIGAYGHATDDKYRSGAAYLFAMPAAGGWADANETVKLVASDGAANDYFGASVAVDGDVALITAEDDDNGLSSGSAYLFTKDSGTWSETAKLTAPDGAANDYFGGSVAVDGSTAVFGAYLADDDATNSGAAYVLDIGDWSDISGSNAATTSHKVTGLTNYEGYWFRIRAVNGAGAGPSSNRRSATPRPGKPDRPTGLSAEAGHQQVTLTWDDPADSNIDNYQISEVVPEKWLTASDGLAGDQFGVSVAVDGNTAVVGAFRDDDNGTDSGSAYVFTRDDEDGEWSQAAKLTPSDGEAGDQFGWAVAVDGDTIVVGAYRDDHGSKSQPGSAYVFIKPDTGWDDENYDGNETAKLTASDAAKDDLFGVSVAVDGDTVVVGAPWKNVPTSDPDVDLLAVGAAYVFTKPATGWVTATETARLPFLAGHPNDHFGFAVAVENDTAFIGVIGAEGFGRNGHGSVYIYIKPAGGWARAVPNARLTASDRAPGDWFGYSVAVDGNTVVVGARLHNDREAGAGSGSAYVFTRESGVWGEKARLTASDGAAGDNFGFSVAVDGDTVVVGSWLDDDRGANSGSAYVFTKPDLGWAPGFETLKLTTLDGAANDRFGGSVSVEGDLALVGAYRDDHSAGVDSGSVYVLGIPDWEGIAGSVATTTAHTVADLDNATEYTFQIRALNQSGGSPASDGASATPLGPPAGLTELMSEAGDTQVRLYWTAATEDSTRALITGYQYQYQEKETDGSVGAWDDNWEDIPDSGPATTEYMRTGLANKAYRFRVRAVNIIDNGPASEVDATPASATPAAPTGLAAAAGDGQVHLTWDDPNDSSIDRYQYTTDDGFSFTDIDLDDISYSEADKFGYTVTGLINGTQYRFRIRALDSEALAPNSLLSGEAPATPMAGEPTAPANLEAKGLDSGVRLTWDDPGDFSIDKHQYQYLQADDAGDFSDWGDVWTDIPHSAPGGVNEIAYPVTGLANGEKYKFRIRAVDLVDEGPGDDEFSAESNEAEATPLPGIPGRPTGLTVDEGDRLVKLSWQAPEGSVVERYEVLHLQTSGLAPVNVAEDDRFGYSVAVDGDISVIGAYRDDENGAHSGAVYLFTRSTGVLWDEGIKLVASDGEAFDNFGISVAVDSDASTVVIGAPGSDGDGADSGSVYVFTKARGVWSQAAKLTASAGAALDYFGHSVAVSGDTVLVGAYQDDDEAADLEDSGSAYVFVKPSGGWDKWDAGVDEEKTKLGASDAADDDYFGTSVALDGDTALIGAPGNDDNGIDSGSFYVFTRDAQGAWNAGVKLTVNDGGPGDSLGVSVAVDGDTAVVGAYQHDPIDPDSDPISPSYLLDAGAAYVFTESSGVWSRQAKLTADDGAAGDYFGYSVAVEGDTAVVGAYRDDDQGSDSGSAYVFTRESGVWSKTNKLTYDDGEAGDWFGYSVAVDTAAHTALVGAGSAHVMDIHDWEEVPGGPQTRSHTFAELTNGREYDFQVRAVNIASEGRESVTTAIPEGGSTGGLTPVLVVNGAPSFVDGESVTLSVPEGTAAGGYVGSAVSATDPDNDSLTYSLSGPDASLFGIVAASGQLVVGSGTVLDYESGTTSYTVVVSVHDGKDPEGAVDSGIDDSIDVTISVTDVDEALALTGPSSVSYPENETVPVAVYVVSHPEGATISWSLSGDDRGAFTIGDGVLSFKVSPDYESLADSDGDNDYEVTIEVSDGVTGSVALGVTVTVTDANDAPVATDDTLDVAEGASAAALDVIANDSDPDGDTLSISAVGAASEGTAVINQGTTTEVTYTPNANFHGSDSFTYTVSDGNGGTDTGTVSITITPLRPEPSDEAPSVSEGAGAERSVLENAEVGTEVGDPVTAGDSDDDGLEYSLSGADQASFDVDAGTGQLTTKTRFDYEIRSEYSVLVQVRDGQGGVDEISVTITVVDVDEPPSQPSAPDVSSAGSTGLAVGWSEPDNQGPEITDYDVRYREAGGDFQDAGYNGIGTSMTLNDLQPGTGYEVQVRAVNAEGTSPWSESGRGETEDTPPAPGSDTTPEGGSDATPESGPDTTPESGPETAPESGSGSTFESGSGSTSESGSGSTPSPGSEPTPAPTSTVEPTPSETDSGDGGFPWWIMLLVVIAVAAWVWHRRRHSRR